MHRGECHHERVRPAGVPRRPDPLTGWSGGTETQAQVSLKFDSLDAAKAYAERNQIDYHVVPPAQRKLRIQAYADNFR